MPIIKSINEISELIPKPDDRLYGCLVTEAPSEVVTDNPLYAFRVDVKTNIIIGMFRAAFTLTRKGEKYYLILTHYDYTDGEISQKDYLSFDRPNNRNVELNDYPFITDNIGIRIDSDRYHNNKIYFGTQPTDVRLLRNELNKQEKIVELEPIIL